MPAFLVLPKALISNAFLSPLYTPSEVPMLSDLRFNDIYDRRCAASDTEFSMPCTASKEKRRIIRQFQQLTPLCGVGR